MVKTDNIRIDEVGLIIGWCMVVLCMKTSGSPNEDIAFNSSNNALNLAQKISLFFV